MQERKSARSHRDPIAWQRAMGLAQKVYELARRLPDYEMYAVTSQVRRAAVSIPSNVAEGYGRATARDLANFLSIAKGSLMELDTLLQLCLRFGYLGEDDLRGAMQDVADVRKLLNAFRRSVVADADRQ